MTPRRSMLALVAALCLLLAACGNDDTTGDPVGDPDEGVGAEPGDGVIDPDGDDDTPDDWDDFPADEAREEARGLLGMFEADLPDDVRISRRGDEQFMLTEDYVLGRATVELDDDGSGYRVMAVTVELPDGPETFELQAS